MLKQMFDDTFEHLGIKALYQQDGFVECTVLIKEPEQSYEIGDGQIIERIATFELKSSDVSNPKIGDFLYANGNKYKVYQEPLLDPSGNVFEIVAIFVGSADASADL
jgi:hypothetical protein